MPTLCYRKNTINVAHPLCFFCYLTMQFRSASNNMANLWTLLQAFCIVLAFMVQASQSQPGFLSLDCGGSGNYTDEAGIEWVADNAYMKLGRNVSLQSYAGGSSSDISAVPRYQRSLRAFDNGESRAKYCYELGAGLVKVGSKYHVRATFVYGNYDSMSSPPSFSLVLDSVVWDAVMMGTGSEDLLIMELVFVAKFQPTNVCLLRGQNGSAPIISALEFRPLASDLYWPSQSNLLIISERTNFGIHPTKTAVRYPDDPYDRVWDVDELESYFPELIANKNISVGAAAGEQPPVKVMQNAITSTVSAPDTLALPERRSKRFGNLYLVMYFAELKVLNSTQLREFQLSIDGDFVSEPIRPEYLKTSNITVMRPYTTKNYMQLTLTATTRSSNMPPLINAMEIGRQAAPYQPGTFPADVDALKNVQRELGWRYVAGGDPCLPSGSTWDWLSCSSDSVPRIMALKLSNRGLSGSIPSSITNLTALQSLDLSNNSFSGRIPEFLANLTDLTDLNLENNKFDSIAPALVKKGINLRLGGNLIRCGNGQCKSSDTTVVLVATLTSVLILALLISLAALALYSRRRKQGKGEEIGNVPTQKFNYKQIRKMTKRFSNQIGSGGFGPVYHGHLPNGMEVAVKVLAERSKQGAKEFKAEVLSLSRLHHRNLVSLVGYCYESEERILVYEYMANGNLHHLLRRDADAENLLDWGTRLDIALKAARGLEYLHYGCRPHIIHRDVKTSNILINDKLEAKISDLGLSKLGPATDQTHITTEVRGTFGYLDPQYVRARQLREKSDVYSFGVVLFEIITGRPVVDPSVESTESGYVVTWAKSMVNAGNVQGLVDKRAKGNIAMSILWKLVELATSCTEENEENRPDMSEVVIQLEEANRQYQLSDSSPETLITHVWDPQITPVPR